MKRPIKKEAQEPGIIKTNPKLYRFLLIAFIAAALVPILFLIIYAEPPERRPNWAPDGCSVFRRVTNGRKELVIEIRNLENFDTDREAAQTIIAAYDAEKEWFETWNSAAIPVDIQLHYPNRSYARNPILFFQKQIIPARLDRLSFIRIPTEYLNEEITIPELREVAEGDHELGFMNLYFAR
jgi:hypothetical protein